MCPHWFHQTISICKPAIPTCAPMNNSMSNFTFQNWTLTNQCTSTWPLSTHHGQDAMVDPFRICPTPKCHVCIWSGGALVGPKPGTTWMFGGLFKGQGQAPGRFKRHPAVRAVHHQSYMVRVWIFCGCFKLLMCKGAYGIFQGPDLRLTILAHSCRCETRGQSVTFSSEKNTSFSACKKYGPF